MASEIGSRQRFFASLSARSRLQLLSFIFFTFAPLSVLVVSRFAEHRSWRSLAAFAALGGATATGWALTFMYSTRMLWVLIPMQTLWWLVPWYFAGDFREGFTFSVEGAACAAIIVVGYVLFVRFTRGEGARSIRMATELSLARQIHESLLPVIDLRGEGLEVYGRSHASSEMGGDLMDVVERDGQTSIYIADVSGHGVKAGVVMAMTKTAVRMRLQSPDGAVAWESVNRILCELSTPDMFVTGACLRFGRSRPADARHSAWFSGAGHGAVLHFRAETETVERLEGDGLPLGIAAGEAYAERPLEVGTGDVFLLMTDGLFETFDAHGRPLGEAPIEARLRLHARGSLPEIHEAVMEIVRAHGPQLDDQTLVLVRAT